MPVEHPFISTKRQRFYVTFFVELANSFPLSIDKALVNFISDKEFSSPQELPDYWALSSVFEALVQKLFFAGSPELAQILEIPGIKHVSFCSYLVIVENIVFS